jgi:ClpP class serine protease
MSKILLHALARGVWAIDPNYAENQLNYIESFLRGEGDGFKTDAHVKISEFPQVYASGNLVEMNSSVWSFDQDLSMIPSGSSVVIPVSGPIIKSNYCGSPGSMTMAKWISKLDALPNCETIILNIDSPGGMVDGTQTLADSIKNCKTKTIAFINDGSCASAAYWIASQCDLIVSSHKTNSVGSIGVYVQLANWEKHYKEHSKLEIISIYSDLSDEKNLPYREALKGNDKLIKEEMLNPLAEAFISAVKENRSGKLNLSAGDPFKGKVYMGEEAIAIGLIDRIGSLQDLLSGGFANSNGVIASNTNPEPTMKKFTLLANMVNLLSFFNKSVDAGNDKIEVEASDAQLAELLNKAESSLQLEAENTELNAKLGSLTEAAALIESDLNAKIAALEAEIIELKQEPGASSQVVKRTADSDPLNADQASNEIDAEAQAIWKQRQSK